jgi:predicted enzyme related to lactoylglutathione lyase
MAVREIDSQGGPMKLVLVLDCPDPESLADFWSAALGFSRAPFYPPYVELTDPSGRWPTLLLQRVPEPKSGKNRMHLDIRVPDMDVEVARLRALGATIVRGPFDDDGYLTTVMRDPQENEFCVIVEPSSRGGA